ncbi:23S rRNA (uracil(1939)-C(5))-methyltransferase RlmD [Clostridium sp. D2Q-11]|uniref:23S rRNA (Uracil(1939)-C(5))-methyltransferase RlmD n=1 Tax=Anaeromonas frigoriresistens TaxID=2683708 RepID=A0A942UZM6_9FIRM|nr:23S rRNA (uracil(1939)-C(5))-methyltransferase RlmD [Anaeromonas frigoriresistens]MBS4537392.1 23S rRNA (uracil(1939)-C(5))-methyltransferase RlmD [Anaeromonas frigoriresistens]
MKPPVIEGDIYEAEVIDLNHRGQGVAKIDGFAIFIDDGIPGDKGNLKIHTVKKNYGIGEFVNISSPSEWRIDAPCHVVDECGGCQIQKIDYDKQLKIKKERVINDMKRIGGMEDIKIHDTLGMKDPFGYRNKAQFPLSPGEDFVKIGFYRRGTHDIVDTNSCIIQHSITDKIIKVVRSFMKKYNVKAYDEKKEKGIIRHILTKTSFRTGDLMIVLITNGEKLPYKEELITELTSNIEGVKSIVQNINTRRNNVILGHKTINLYGEDKIVDYIDDIKFNISPLSFFQVNPIQTEVLYNKALEYADLQGDETVFDLYCGIGSISLFLAKKAKKVYGIEVVKLAIEDAKKNAKINKITNAEFFTGKAEEVFPKLYKQGIRADVVVVDPPRKGCEQKVLDTIIEMNPKKVVYVSCNPATLARDLKYLNENGYKTLEIQPVDMFPHTVHVETVVLMSRV